MNCDLLSKKLFSKKIIKRTSVFVDKQKVHSFVHDILEILYPHFSKANIPTVPVLSSLIRKKELELGQILQNLVPMTIAKKTTAQFIQGLSKLSDTLDKDAEAIFNGDPAAKAMDEIVYSYPGFFATAAYRIANFFYTHKIPLLPRMITEYAHQLTGIDIHPGATIGKNFCIDHGTGIVIGETTIIGDDVKIYQGVTLGALSLHGRKSVGKKRHPTIENNCVVYSNTTILGGDTVIGKNSVIGGNIWLIKSVPSNSFIYRDYTSNEIKHSLKKTKKGKTK